VDQTAYIFLLEQGLSFFREETLEGLFNKLRLLKIFKSAYGAFQHDETELEHVKSTVCFLIKRLLTLFHEVFLGSTQVERTK
jgi:hypothetical protein